MHTIYYNKRARNLVISCFICAKMSKCCVPGCMNTRNNSASSFHTFPSDSKIREAWITRIGVADTRVKPWSTVCSCHFVESDYERDLRAELIGCLLYTSPSPRDGLL